MQIWSKLEKIDYSLSVSMSPAPSTRIYLVTYLFCAMQTLPDHFLQQNQLSSIILEYRKECGSSDVVQSICQPDEDSIPLQENVSMVNGPSLLPEIIRGHPSLAGALQQSPMKYTHLLQLKAGDKYDEIVRGRTTWKKKSYKAPWCVHIWSMLAIYCKKKEELIPLLFHVWTSKNFYKLQ